MRENNIDNSGSGGITDNQGEPPRRKKYISRLKRLIDRVKASPTSTGRSGGAGSTKTACSSSAGATGRANHWFGFHNGGGTSTFAATDDSPVTYSPHSSPAFRHVSSAGSVAPPGQISGIAANMGGPVFSRSHRSALPVDCCDSFDNSPGMFVNQRASSHQFRGSGRKEIYTPSENVSGMQLVRAAENNTNLDHLSPSVHQADIAKPLGMISRDELIHQMLVAFHRGDGSFGLDDIEMWLDQRRKYQEDTKPAAAQLARTAQLSAAQLSAAQLSAAHHSRSAVDNNVSSLSVGESSETTLWAALEKSRRVVEEEKAKFELLLSSGCRKQLGRGKSTRNILSSVTEEVSVGQINNVRSRDRESFNIKQQQQNTILEDIRQTRNEIRFSIETGLDPSQITDVVGFRPFTALPAISRVVIDRDEDVINLDLLKRRFNRLLRYHRHRGSSVFSSDGSRDETVDTPNKTSHQHYRYFSLSNHGPPLKEMTQRFQSVNILNGLAAPITPPSNTIITRSHSCPSLGHYKYSEKYFKKNDDTTDTVPPPPAAVELSLNGGNNEVDSENVSAEKGVSGCPVLKLELPPRGSELDFSQFNYEYVDFLAEGGLGRLYLVRRISGAGGGSGAGAAGAAAAAADGSSEMEKLWVAKVVEFSSFPTPAEATQALLEAELLRRLKHPNIVEYRDSHVTDTHLVIVMEYCERGDLHGHICDVKRRRTQRTEDQEERQRTNQISEKLVVRWISDIARGLSYMHQQHIIHCDIKSSNIFIDSDLNAKIGDLGIARELNSGADALSPLRCPRGTPVYMSPEMCKRAALTERSDCWSLGCILFELCHLEHAFPSQLSLGRRRQRLDNDNRLKAKTDCEKKSIASCASSSASSNGKAAFLPGLTGRSDMSYLGREMLTNIRSDLRKIKHNAVKQTAPQQKQSLTQQAGPTSSTASASSGATGIATGASSPSVPLKYWTDSSAAAAFLLPQVLPPHYSPLLNYLVCAMLEPAPSDRPTLQTIIHILSEAAKHYDKEHDDDDCTWTDTESGGARPIAISAVP